MTNILSDYLAEIARIRATRAGTGEVSYYGALAGALNAAGERLKPKVFCVPNLRNRGSGFPDMGLFVAARVTPPVSSSLQAARWLPNWPPSLKKSQQKDLPIQNQLPASRAFLWHYLATALNCEEFPPHACQ